MDTADTASPYFIGPSYIGLSKSGAEYIDRVRLKHQTFLTHFMPPYMMEDHFLFQTSLGPSSVYLIF